MSVTRIPYADLDEKLKNQLQKSSLFASESFCNLFKTAGGNPVCFLLSNENHPTVALVGVEFGLSIFKRFQSMPDGCYSSLISLDGNDPINSRDALNILDAVKNCGYTKSFIFDYHSHFPKVTNYTVSICTTQIASISPEWQPPDKKLLSEIRKAEKEGVEIIPYDKEKYADQFYSLVESTAHRHGKKAWYCLEFYDSLADLACTDKRIDWTIVTHDSKLAASHINFRINDTLINWQVHFDKKYSFLKPNQYLLYRAAIKAAQAGAKFLNLGATPSDAESLEAYKRKWGGQEYRYNCIEMKSLLGKLF